MDRKRIIDVSSDTVFIQISLETVAMPGQQAVLVPYTVVGHRHHGLTYKLAVYDRIVNRGEKCDGVRSLAADMAVLH